MSANPEHGALMDRIYRHQRYIYDLTRKYYLFGRDRMIAGLDLKPGDSLVEIGCGTARNLVKIAKAYPGTKLYGVDASTEMLKSAAATVRRAGLEDRITLVEGYAEHLSPELCGAEGKFDTCLFSYSLSMIPDWKSAIAAANANLAPGGRIQIVDFADLTGLSALGRKAMLTWLALFHVAPRTELIAALEHCPGAELRFLPGRYAFLLTARSLAL